VLVAGVKMPKGAVLKWRQIFPREEPLDDGR
jgi:hypothetical protein